MSASLVGSEMCIRDRLSHSAIHVRRGLHAWGAHHQALVHDAEDDRAELGEGRAGGHRERCCG
eukprot:7304649-Alexandrium_andersonii.AAC.1